MSILWLETVKQNYNHFFSETQLIEGVCVVKKENRTFSPKVGLFHYSILFFQQTLIPILLYKYSKTEIYSNIFCIFQVVEVTDEVFACNETSDCWSYDVNFLCQESQCVCRDGTRYNKQLVMSPTIFRIETKYFFFSLQQF